KRRGAYEILAFIILYKIGDVMAANMTTPFILNIGFSKTDLAVVAKTFGIIAIIGGGLLGGILLLRIGLLRALWIFGILQAGSTLAFSALASVGYHYYVLVATVAFENFTSGMGASAFIAFMASLCNRKFTATQYALLSSLMGIPRVIIASPTGYLAEWFGWVHFFIFCTLAATPGLVFLFRYNTWQEVSSSHMKATGAQGNDELSNESQPVIHSKEI
ncbi:MAG TPA: MFS transporter, partial [Candidatus Wunengus californicus]|uniref:MFS transporter n=1 Tax=Candidatus Wunengus californicus TaxID=3367619 RepID=UPI004027CE0D